MSTKQSKSLFFTLIGAGFTGFCLLTLGYISTYEKEKNDFTQRREHTYRQLYQLKGILYHQSELAQKSEWIAASNPGLKFLNQLQLAKSNNLLIVAKTATPTAEPVMASLKTENPLLVYIPTIFTKGIIVPPSQPIFVKPALPQDPSVYTPSTPMSPIKPFEIGFFAVVHSAPEIHFTPMLDLEKVTSVLMPYHLKTSTIVLNETVNFGYYGGIQAGYHLHRKIGVFTGLQHGYFEGTRMEQQFTHTYDPANAPSFVGSDNFDPTKPIGIEGIATDEYLMERKDTLIRRFKANYFEIPVFARFSIVNIGSWHLISEAGLSGRFNTTVQESAIDAIGEVHSAHTNHTGLESMRSRFSAGIEYRNAKGFTIQLQPTLDINLFQLGHQINNTPFSTEHHGLRWSLGYRF